MELESSNGNNDPRLVITKAAARTKTKDNASLR